MAARAAARVARPIGKYACTGMPANFHSGNRRTSAGLQLAAACPAAGRGDAESRRGGGNGPFVLIGREMRFELNLGLLAVSFESPGRRDRGGRACDDAVPDKLVGCLRSPVASEVFRRRDGDTRDHGDELRGGCRVRQSAEPYGDVDRVPDEIVPPVAQLKLDTQVRVPLGECGEARYHVADAESWSACSSVRARAVRRPRERCAPPHPSAARIGSIRARNSPPASVGTTARVVRDNSLTPSSASRSATMREAWDWDRPHSRAAAEKLPRRATRGIEAEGEMILDQLHRLPTRRGGQLPRSIDVF